MQFFVNGQSVKMDIDSLAELVKRKKLEANSLVVELDGQIIPQEKWEITQISQGSRIELITFVGGG